MGQINLEETLASNGWIKLENLIDREHIEMLISKYDYIFESCKNDNYSNVAEIRESQLSRQPEIKSILSLVKSKIDFLGGDKYKLDKFWLVKSKSENIDQAELPFVPHIDRRRLLKLMIYVSDVSLSDGPLTVATASPDSYEELRKSFPANNLNKNNIIKDSLHYTPMTGLKGDAILFDTNCPHYASTIDIGRMRKVLRVDFLHRKEPKIKWWEHLQNLLYRLSKNV